MVYTRSAANSQSRPDCREKGEHTREEGVDDDEGDWIGTDPQSYHDKLVVERSDRCRWDESVVQGIASEQCSGGLPRAAV